MICIQTDFIPIILPYLLPFRCFYCDLDCQSFTFGIRYIARKSFAPLPQWMRLEGRVQITEGSLLVGALSGVLYLRLLARSIGKLGTSSKSVGKIQLIVPVLLVLAVSKLSQLELLPALLGFLLYKPSLVFQILLESRSQA